MTQRSRIHVEKESSNLDYKKSADHACMNSTLVGKSCCQISSAEFPLQRMGKAYQMRIHAYLQKQDHPSSFGLQTCVSMLQ